MSNNDLERMYEEEVAEFKNQLDLVWEVAEVMGYTIPAQKEAKAPLYGLDVSVVKDLMPSEVFKGAFTRYMVAFKGCFNGWGDVVGWFIDEQKYLIVGFNKDYNLGLVVDDRDTTLKIAPLGDFNTNTLTYNQEVLTRYEKRLQTFQQLNSQLVSQGSHTYLTSFDNSYYKGLYVRNVDRMKGNNFSDF